MHFLSRIIGIVIIDLVLSGDNAVVIGMAAHRLPVPQRKRAIIIGGGVAILLRMVLTAIAALLLQIPGLQIVGGLLLLWIAFKLLKEDEESKEGLKTAANMREAILTIIAADFIMSLDNVLAVAGASQGEIPLLLFGLILSMPILLWSGSVVANLINRFAWLSYVGATIIAWTGALMVFEDPVILSRARWLSRPVAYAVGAVITVAVTASAHWFHRGRGFEEE